MKKEFFDTIFEAVKMNFETNDQLKVRISPIPNLQPAWDARAVHTSFAVFLKR